MGGEEKRNGAPSPPKRRSPDWGGACSLWKAALPPPAVGLFSIQLLREQQPEEELRFRGSTQREDIGSGGVLASVEAEEAARRCITFKALHGLGTGHLRDCLLPYSPPCTLRSSEENLLQLSKTRLTTVTQRTFSLSPQIVEWPAGGHL